jgi:hydroxymethylpyrimidine pyrophosphatase-like HAD family hydrolase
MARAEAQEGKEVIIAVDFDGTLCQNAWPDIGRPRSDIIDHVRSARANGAKLILWTNREGERLQEALSWCADGALSLVLYFALYHREEKLQRIIEEIRR